MIVDMHVHVLPESSAQRTTRLFTDRTGEKLIYDFSINKLLERMGSAVDKTCINNGVLRGDLVPKASNWVAKQVQLNPDRLVGMYTPHPDMQDTAGELERSMKELGFKGVKLNPSLHHYYPEDPRMRPFWEKANELAIPVLTHGGRNVEDFKIGKLDSTRRFCEPSGFRPIIEAYPNITYIIAHFAGFEDYGDEAVKIVNDYPNVYTDISMMFSRLSPEQIIAYIRAVGAKKVMFGSDYPGFDPQEYVRKINAFDLTDAEKSAIMGDNAARVFKLH